MFTLEVMNGLLLAVVSAISVCVLRMCYVFY